MVCHRYVSIFTLLVIFHLIISDFHCVDGFGGKGGGKASHGGKGGPNANANADADTNGNANANADVNGGANGNANGNANMGGGRKDDKNDDKKEDHKEDKKSVTKKPKVPPPKCKPNPNYKGKWPPGYKESVLTISAFCVTDDECMAPKTQNHLYACLRDDNGDTAEFVSKLSECNTPEADFCDPDSIAVFQKCVEKLAEAKREDICIPQKNRWCMRDDLSLRTLECLRSKFKSLSGLFPLSADPKESPDKE